MGKTKLIAFDNDTYALTLKIGNRKILDINNIPNNLHLDGSWEVCFDRTKGGPTSVIFDELT